MNDFEIINESNEGNLFLRKISKTDSRFVFNSLNQEGMVNYLSLGPLKTLEYSKRLIRSYLKLWDDFIQFNYIIEIRNANQIRIGSISLWNVNWRHRRAEIGIWIIPSYWNKGFGKISIELIKNIGFNHLKLNRLEAHMAVENKRSISLFKQCGFEVEGTLKKYLNFEGHYYDALILSCLRANLYLKKIE